MMSNLMQIPSSAAGAAVVAQTSSLLYRRPPVCKRYESGDAVEISQPFREPTPCRLKVCATADRRSAPLADK
jgi:hypothetical protein